MRRLLARIQGMPTAASATLRAFDMTNRIDSLPLRGLGQEAADTDVTRLHAFFTPPTFRW
jgi:hypothetical protein